MKHCGCLFRIFVVVFLLIFKCVNCSTTPCANFEFPSLNDTVLSAAENTTVSFPFTVNSDNCSSVDDQPQTLQVTRLGTQFDVFCQIFLRREECFASQRTSCTCTEDAGVYQFTRNVTRSDNKTWEWSSNSGFVQFAAIAFNILYPASVLNFSITQQDDLVLSVVNQSSTVDAVCIWDMGNPPVTARLLDRHGVEMEGSIYSSGQINYRFPAVGCQDAGLIRCEAPGASQNKSATLLVRCPPEFQSTDKQEVVIGTNGVNLQAAFYLRTHTRSFLQGRLWKLAKLDQPDIRLYITHPANKTFQKFIRLTGTPPDLTLTVRLDNVKKEEEGQWRLELTNDVGTGHVDFILHVIEPVLNITETETAPSRQTSTRTTVPVHESPDVKSDDPLERIDFTVIGSVAIGFITIAVTIISVSVICIKRGQTIAELPDERRQPVNIEMEEPIHGHHPPGTESGQSVHYYFEIPDDTPPSSPEPPRRCLSPALPEDYLHPSVSRDVTEGTDGAKNVAPLYENTQLSPVLDAETSACTNSDT